MSQKVLFEICAIDPDIDIDTLVNEIKGIDVDGVIWDNYKIHDVGYGVKKIQIMSTVPFDMPLDNIVSTVGSLSSVYSVDILTAYVPRTAEMLEE